MRGSGGGGDRRSVSQAGEQRATQIEALRGLGAILVVLAHVGAVTFAVVPGVPTVVGVNEFLPRGIYGAGNFALFIFFAISGYVIYFPFAKRDFAGGKPVNLRRYATNRALRIFPLYYVVVIVVLAIQYDFPRISVWGRFFTFTQNFFDFTAFKFVGPSWSLVVELHFYILLPFLALGIARLAQGSARRGLAILFGVYLASVAVRALTVYIPDRPDLVWRASTAATFLFIATGMMGSIIHVSWEQRRPSWLRGPLLNSDLWLLATVPPFLLFAYYRYHFDWVMAFAALAVVGAASFPHLRRGPITRILWWRPLAFIGLAAYSIYLWHIPLITLLLDLGVPADEFLVFGVVVLPIAVGIGLLSYKLIEEPFLRMRRRWSPSAPPQQAPGGPAPQPSPP
jgi:peptidoglycan/LPS O-acetylase OafA/YrhL